MNQVAVPEYLHRTVLLEEAVDALALVEARRAGVYVDGTLEAIRFMKGEKDIIDNYDKHYLQSITLLKQLGDGKLRQDAYRSGQFRAPIS